jgi:LysM repeat protein
MIGLLTKGGKAFPKLKKIIKALRSNKEAIKKTEGQIKTLTKKSAKDKKFAGFSNPKKLNTAKNRLKRLKAADQKRIKNMQKAGLAVGATTAGVITADNVIDKVLKDLKQFKPYTIKKGDTLSEIAKANGTTLKAIKEANPGIKDLNKIRVGQKINISPKVKDRKSVYQGMTKSEMAAISKDKTVGRKHGGQIGKPKGIGAALRGYGKGYK